MSTKASLMTTVSVAILCCAASAQLFELDGNALQDVAPPPEDWELLYDSGANTGGSSLAFTGVVPDAGQQTIFTGGRKDIQELSSWKWKNDGGFPDKNDITNAYAAAYNDPGSGDLIAYFGADRFSNNGDAFIGFWFFQNSVTLNQNGTFDGLHSVGDILVLVNYPQGSPAEPEVQVIEWNPALEDIGNNLHLLYSGVAAVCGDVPPSEVCAITNDIEQPSPWPYTPKSGTPGFFPIESFFEGGINLTQILGGNPCFASFLAETRSSTSMTATLKDFVIGDFPVCAIGVDKTCDVVDVVGGMFRVEFSGQVTNTGGGTFPAGSIVTITDDAGTPGDSGDDIIIVDVLGAPLAPGATVPFSGEFTSITNPPINSVSATLQFGTTVVSAAPYSIECEALPLNPALALTKQCDSVLETIDDKLVIRIDFTGEVSNTGDIPLTVTVEDDKAGLVLSATFLAPGESALIGGSYYPTEASGGQTDPGQAMFSDTFTATGTSPFLAMPVVEMVSANCPLCP